MGKPAIIFFDGLEKKIMYFIIDDDLSYLHNVYINCYVCWAEKELFSLLYDNKGNYRLESIKIENFREHIKDGAVLIECGIHKNDKEYRSSLIRCYDFIKPP